MPGGLIVAGLPAHLEDVAVFAVAQIELITYHRPVKRMGAEGELSVDDRVGAEVIGDLGDAARVPAVAMSFFRVHAVIVTAA